MYGQVFQIEENRETGYQKIIIQSREFKEQDERIPVIGKVLIKNYNENYDVSLGDFIEADVYLHKPSLPGNFGDFNEREYLMNQGIFVIGAVYQRHLTKNTKRTSRNLFISMQKFKTILNEKIDEIYQIPYQGLVKAIITGDRNDIPKHTIHIFQDAGIMHVLAISGLHIGIMAFFLLLLFKKMFFLNNNKISYSLIIIFLFGYSLLTGFRASVIRAALMFSIHLLSQLINRPYNMLSSLGITAFIILLFKPLSLFDTGFLLSFFVTFFIVFAFPVIERVFLFFPVYLRKSLSISLSAWIGMAPLSVYFFSKLSFISILSNIFIVPLMSIALILSLVSICFSFILIPLGHLLVSLNQMIIFILFRISSILSSLPYAFSYFGRPGLGLIFLYFILVILLIDTLDQWTIYTLGVRKKRIWMIYFNILILALIYLFPLANQLEVHFINVGQGDCILIRTPQNKNILIDGGGTPFSEYDIGINVVIPYLRRQGVHKIDLVILSHPDVDHLEGLLPILKNMSVRHVVDGGIISDEELYQEFISIIRENKKIKFSTIKSGDRIQIALDLDLLVYHPNNLFTFNQETHFNNQSVVLKLRYKNNSFLFTGDIEFPTEIYLLSKENSLNSDILKVAHHGSNTSSSQFFLDKVEPEIAIISVGSNHFGHPHPEVLKRLSEKCQNVLRTDLNGTIIIKSDGERYLLRTLR